MGFLPEIMVLGEVVGSTASGITAEQASKLGESLQSFGSMLLDNFITLLPPLAVFAAIWFVIRIVKKKVRA